MNKNDLKSNDIIVFANNHSAVFGENNRYMIEQHFDDELKCIDNPDYDIMKIYRPQYEVIYERGKTKKK